MESLAIYILCHNRPEDAKQAIFSVLNQVDQNFNLVVSDNSSNDEVESMVKAEFPTVTYIRRVPMLPAIHHFKQCIDEVQENYFCLFHDDDLMHPDFVSSMKKVIHDFPSAVAIASNANIDYFGSIKHQLSFRSFKSHELISTPRELAARYFSRAQSGIAPFPTYIYNRHLIAAHRLPVDGGKYGDVTWLLNLAKVGPIVWLNKPLITYRLHSNNDGNVESLRDRLRLLRYLKQNKISIGGGVLQDYRCSFIYKKISNLTDKSRLNRRNLAISFLNTYRWSRYARFDTYLSLANRALIKLKTKS